MILLKKEAVLSKRFGKKEEKEVLRGKIKGSFYGEEIEGKFLSKSEELDLLEKYKSEQKVTSINAKILINFINTLNIDLNINELLDEGNEKDFSNIVMEKTEKYDFISTFNNELCCYKTIDVNIKVKNAIYSVYFKAGKIIGDYIILKFSERKEEVVLEEQSYYDNSVTKNYIREINVAFQVKDI